MLLGSATELRFYVKHVQKINLKVKKVVIFWDTAPCSPYMTLRFGGTYHLYVPGRKSAELETSVEQVAMQNFGTCLLIIAHLV
jgi:hypothetical protein